MICSVIVPIYKGNKYIENIVDMIQKWVVADDIKLEIIFVNDSPEQPITLPQWKNQSMVPITVLDNQRNMGIHYSRIVGAQYAMGEYIVFLDQDDTLNDNYLKSQLQHIEEEDAVICNGLYRNGETIFSLSNPMKNEYSFEEYLDYGYPMVSLGQLLIKRKSIPLEWLNHVMMHNGWDDHFLWATMMANNTKVNINDDILYTHEEDGNNTSFNWKQMSRSGQNFKDIFLKLNFMNDIQEKKFRFMTDSKISKYEDYHELETLLSGISSNQFKEYFHLKDIQDISIYGFGVYGKKLYEILIHSGFKVAYCIDKRSDAKNVDSSVVSLHKNMQKVDAIVVSPVNSFHEIKREIEKYCSYEVLSLLDILKEINSTGLSE